MGFRDWELMQAHGPTIAGMTGQECLTNTAIGLYVKDTLAFYFDHQGHFLGTHAGKDG